MYINCTKQKNTILNITFTIVISKNQNIEKSGQTCSRWDRCAVYLLTCAITAISDISDKFIYLFIEKTQTSTYRHCFCVFKTHGNRFMTVYFIIHISPTTSILSAVYFTSFFNIFQRLLIFFFASSNLVKYQYIQLGL